MTKIKEFGINDLDIMGGVFAISLVEMPAIESDFVALKKQNTYMTLAKADKEKRMLYGAALIPNKPIFRLNQETGEEFYMHLSKETVRHAAYNFLSKGFQRQFTEQHEKPIEGVTVVESWIIEDAVNDKSKAFGFNLSAGTWFVGVKVDNEEVWDKIKNGEVKGFSIEAQFAEKLSKQLNGKSEAERLTEILSKIL
jgi:hypothetical protein